MRWFVLFSGVFVLGGLTVAELASLTDKSPKSLMRMFGPTGNPYAHNLFEVISRVQQHEGVQLEVNSVR